MPWPTYSERFILYSKPTLGKDIYVIPDGMRAVVTCLTATNYSGVRAGCRLRAHGHTIAYIDLQVPKVTDSLQLYVVVYSRQQLDVYLDQSPSACSVSGFLFADPDAPGGPPEGAQTKPIIEVTPEPMAA